MKRCATLMLVALGLVSLSSCPAGKSPSSMQARLRKAFESDSFAASYRTKQLAAEGPFARMLIRKLGVDVIVAQGTTGNALQAGAGHYVQTPFAGELGNVAIAGARDGNGETFRYIDRLREGDEIELVVPAHRYVYAVVPPFDGHSNPWVTTPNDLSTVSPTDYAALTLTTADPPGTSKNRLIVRLRLVRDEVATR